MLVTCDGAGATLDLIEHITTLNAAPGRRVRYSVGFDLDARGRTAISQLCDTAWDQVLDHRGTPRDPDDAGVAELTGLLRALRGRGSAGHLASRHAHHLPPRTALVAGRNCH